MFFRLDRCVLFGTGRIWRFYQRNKAYLDPLSSTFNLKVEVENHTQIRLVPLSTKDKMSHVEGHHEISTSYLNAIELLPIWIMFIDRIIDRI